MKDNREIVRTPAISQGPAPKHTEVDNLLTSGEFKTLIGNAKARRRNTLAPVMRNTLFDIKQNFESKPMKTVTAISGIDNHDVISDDETDSGSISSEVFVPTPSASKLSSNHGSFRLTFSRQ